MAKYYATIHDTLGVSKIPLRARSIKGAITEVQRRHLNKTKNVAIFNTYSRLDGGDTYSILEGCVNRKATD